MTALAEPIEVTLQVTAAFERLGARYLVGVWPCGALRISRAAPRLDASILRHGRERPAVAVFLSGPRVFSHAFGGAALGGAGGSR